MFIVLASMNRLVVEPSYMGTVYLRSDGSYTKTVVPMLTVQEMKTAVRMSKYHGLTNIKVDRVSN